MRNSRTERFMAKNYCATELAIFIFRKLSAGSCGNNETTFQVVPCQTVISISCVYNALWDIVFTATIARKVGTLANLLRNKRTRCKLLLHGIQKDGR